MREFFSTIWQSVKAIEFEPKNIIEIVILAILIYYIVVWIKNSRTWFLFRGILVLLIFIGLANLLELNVLTFIADADALAGIENIPNAPALSMQNGQLLLTGHRPGATAEVYTLGGRLCSRKAVGSNGQATISLSSLPNGIYIVRTPVGIRKFVKK